VREAEMFEPFWRWLVKTRRVRKDALYVRELPWLGRRVDLAILNTSGSLTAYEFKLTHNIRAIRQAAYNAHAFHRSYVVTATVPSWRTLEIARKRGVGVIALSPDDGSIRTICAARAQHFSPATRRLRESIRKRGSRIDV